MASGKTTFGSALAEYCGKVFVDLDEYIQNRRDATINEIFKKEGEHGFRELERKALKECCRMPDAIVACGGGTPCFFDNMEILNNSGTTVFLEATDDTLCRRLMEGNSERPLVKGKNETEIRDFIKKHLKERLPYYAKAKIRWDSNKLESREEIETSVKKFIAENPFVFSESFL